MHVLFVQKRVHNATVPNNEHKLDTPVHVLVAAKYLSNLGAITVVVRRRIADRHAQIVRLNST
ncbi:MAG: hypothetical protein ABIK43_04445 [candidate division WOR-3 bacterium]